MPHITDTNFHQTVIYICSHNKKGATGIIVNRYLTGLTLRDLFNQTNIPMHYSCKDRPLYWGGPVDISQGLVLHTLDYKIGATEVIQDHVGVTSSLEILKAISRTEGPQKTLVTLGYTSWQAGQLEAEMSGNHWIMVEATDYLLFDADIETKWRTAFASIGVNPALLSMDFGHA